MAKVLLVTAPYSGTHFSANLLRLLQADYAYCHTFPYYLEPWNIPKWVDEDGHKVIVATRNPWDSMFTAYNRREIWLADNPGVNDTRDVMVFQLERLKIMRAIREAYAPFEIRVDEMPADANAFLNSLAAYCDVPVTAEARTFVATWPITGGVVYDPIRQPAALGQGETDDLKQLSLDAGYADVSTWNTFKQEAKTGPTRENLRPLIVNNRAIIKLGNAPRQ